MASNAEKLKIAVVGGGVAGIVAAYVISRKHTVTIFEREQRLGGHTNTITINQGPDAGTPVDTGFIVCNSKNYPNFYRFLDQLGVPRRDSDMCFGFQCERSGLTYLGPTLRAFLARPSNLLQPQFLRMLSDRQRFNRRALADLESGALKERTLGDYFRELKVSRFFVENYMIPLAAAVWSSPDSGIYDFPAQTFIRFFANHGMLNLSELPQWQTVVGGSARYVTAFKKLFPGEIRLGSPVQQIIRTGQTVRVQTGQAEAEHFDAVVLASHADESLQLLADASEAERRLLGKWTYSRNDTVLHSDPSLLPSNRKFWASWNYRRRAQASSTEPVSISYYMNRLQGLRTQADYIVTLNGRKYIDPAAVIYATEYHHPVYTSAAVQTQAELLALSGTNRTYFCGAYLRYGFHEDAVISSLAAAEKLGVAL